MNIFSVSAETTDVEILLGNVADALRQWEGGEAMSLDLTLMVGESERVAQRAQRLKSQWNVDSGAIIHSTRPGLGPWIIRFQHTMRRLTWWFLEPILMQIRAFQMNVALVVDGLAQNQERYNQSLQQHETEIAKLQKRLGELEAEVQKLHAPRD